GAASPCHHAGTVTALSMRVLTPMLALAFTGCVNSEADSATTSGEDDSGGSGSGTASAGTNPTGGGSLGETTGATTNEASTGEATAESAGGPAGTGSDPGVTGGDETGPACPPAEVSIVRGCEAIVGEGFCSEGQEHVPDGSEIDWASDPPHSG